MPPLRMAQRITPSRRDVRHGWTWLATPAV